MSIVFNVIDTDSGIPMDISLTELSLTILRVLGQNPSEEQLVMIVSNLEKQIKERGLRLYLDQENSTP